MFIGFFLSWLLVIISEGNWLKTDKRFIIKKLIDCVVPVITYAYLVYSHYICLKIGTRTVLFVLGIGALLTAVIYIWFFVDQIVFFSKVPFKQMRKMQLSYILLSLFFTLLFAATIINYVSYILWPTFYAIPTGLSHAETGFEFLYYTFTLMVTYSGTSIAAVHIAAKVLQIIEIAAFYILLGVFFADLIAKNKSAQGLSEE